MYDDKSIVIYVSVGVCVLQRTKEQKCGRRMQG